jgi:hypothetical protein
MGARLFSSLYEFRVSLVDYLESMPAERVQARLTSLGLSIMIKPLRPAIFNLYWEENELEFKVNLAWNKPDGSLALAPWRQANREQFINGINSRNWQDLSFQYMPRGSFLHKNDMEPEIPLFEPDPTLSAETLTSTEAIN